MSDARASRASGGCRRDEVDRDVVAERRDDEDRPADSGLPIRWTRDEQREERERRKRAVS